MVLVPATLLAIIIIIMIPPTTSQSRTLTSPLLLDNTSTTNVPTTAIVLLNSPSFPESSLLPRFWQSSTLRVCADGGANRLYSYLDTLALPDAICGDLDSLQPSVLAYYRDQGVKIVQDVDQNRNDLDKSLRVVSDAHCERCIVYGAFGGRFDQEMGCFQALYAWNDRIHELWLYDDHTCAILLSANVLYSIRLAANGGGFGEGPTCGLIPLGGPCDSVTTTGLQWNLQAERLAFGGLVSTSNRVVDDVITVFSANQPIVFTAEVHCCI